MWETEVAQDTDLKSFSGYSHFAESFSHQVLTFACEEVG
jgi:hypothetical protein